MRRMVDLPHPDGPTSTMNSPSSMSRDTSSTATTSEPNCLVIPSRTIFAMSHPLRGGPPPLRRLPGTYSRRPEPRVRQRSSDPAPGRGGGFDLVETEEGRTEDGGGPEDPDLGLGRDRHHARADPLDESRILGPEDPTTQHDI